MTSAIALSRPPTAARALASLFLAVSLLVTLLPPVQAQEEPMTVTRHAGASRTETAAQVSLLAYPEGADTVVIARADAYGDALAGAPLAAVLDAPVLLSNTDAMDQFTEGEIQRLAPTTAVVLGDLSDAVTDTIEGLGVTVERIRGTDAWTTYAAIADAVVAESGTTQALLVEGMHPDDARGWPDALTASAWAATEQMPVLMTEVDAFPAATGEAITRNGITQVTVVGGEAAVSADVAAEADELTSEEIDRVAGDGRYDTGVAVAREGLDEFGYTSRIWVASGRSWPDALVAGPAVAKMGGVLVLTDPASMEHSPATLTFINGQRGWAANAHLVGGTAVISEDVAATVETGELPGAESEETDPGATPVASLDRPPAVPARNTAPPISAATPWSDPATWGGTVPAAGDVVTIPRDRAVLLDVDPPALEGIQIDGLLVADDIDMTIEVEWITVTGRLALGTEEAPLTSDVTVILDPQPGDDILGAGEGPIAVQGGTLDIHGQSPTHTWTRLAATAGAGTTQIQLEEAPGWSVGDRIVIAATSLNFEEAEERIVTAIDGTTVTLDRPLEHIHWGQAEQVGGETVEQFAEVGSLSRNIVVTSTPEAREQQRGGHVQIFHGSVGRISGAEFTGLGQVGELARYPIHFHMMDSASGSYIHGAAVHHSFNRCVTVHGTHHVDLQETIGYDTIGHCFFFEDGVETGNTFHCNLGLTTRAPEEGLALLESDLTPATYWISNPSNHFTENVAAGSESAGFWYDLPEAPTGDSEGVELDIRSLPFGTFDGNVAHSSDDDGFKNGVGIFVEDYFPPEPAIMTGNTSYKNGSFGAWIEGTELHDTMLSGNGIGFLGLRAALRDSTVVGSTLNDSGDVPWRLTGVGFYHQRSEISDVQFINFGQRPRDWMRQGLAMEFIANDRNEISVVTGASFLNANRLQITRPDDPEDGPDNRSAAIRDADGSISGAPAVLASNHPLVYEPSCTWREEFGAHACAPQNRLAWLKIVDMNGGISGATLTRSDGFSAAFGDPDPGETAEGDVLMDRAYAVSSATPHSGHLEIILSGREEGFVDLEIPWPHAEAHAYDGWGRWHEISADANFSFDGSVIRLRHNLDDFEEDGRYQRIEVCAAEFCGNDGPGG
ncbi:cell wall-binding repeat-containing protein [Euzebya tangerina]|uniref:cell wall-binding repeat-containing protein n=1 Tax=Euzebya tangerina TaxID=591198 RepID=UPI0013C3609A|nr:cell wall-binding repeat-containing protein [Euzebya tangerina]